MAVLDWLKKNLSLEVEEERPPDVRDTPSVGDPAQPRTFEEYIGQSEAVRLCKVEVSAALRQHRPLAHLLFTGPPGVGKTALSHVLAGEMGGLPIYESTGAEFPTQKEVYEAFARMSDWWYHDYKGKPIIWLIDELDGMPRIASYPCHTWLTHNFISWHGRRYGGPVITLIGTTNHTAGIPKALLSRFGDQILITYYSPTELALIGRQAAHRMGFELNDEAAEWAGANSAGEPRKIIRRILRNVANLLDGKKQAGLEVVQEALKLSGLRPLGFSRSQYGYLSYLSRCRQSDHHGEDFTAGLQSIAAYLGEDASDIRLEVEPFLIRSEYVRVTRQGRTLTERGQDYLRQYPED